MDQAELYIPEQKSLGKLMKSLSLDTLDQKLQKAILVSGFPYDEGTKRNNGRIGGAMASTIFRRYLQQKEMYIHQPISLYDTADISTELELEKAHEQLFIKHKNILKTIENAGSILVSIGGSNDQSYCNVRALMEVYPDKKIGVINIDSHFDVRPLKQGKAHSGSPFRQMLQNPLFQKNGSIFAQFATKGLSCSQEHFKYLQTKNTQVYWLEKDIRTTKIPANSKFKTQAGHLFNQIIQRFIKDQVQIIFISFDVDAISNRFMPGVSAPSVIGGLTSEEAIQIMNVAGLCKNVKLIDFSEFNPAVESLISSAMLVQMFYALCKSFGSR